MAAAVEPVPQFAVRSLLHTPTISVRDVACAGGARGRGGEERASETQLVFPYRGAYVRHLGRDEAVAERTVRSQALSRQTAATEGSSPQGRRSGARLAQYEHATR